MADLNAGAYGRQGQTVQADETYYGNTSKRAKGYKKGHSHKASVVALVEPKGRVARVPCQVAPPRRRRARNSRTNVEPQVGTAY